MLIGGEPSKIDESTEAVVFLWGGEKWYEEFAEVFFVEAFMDSLPSEDFLFIRLAKIMTTLKLAVAFVASRLGCMWKGKL